MPSLHMSARARKIRCFRMGESRAAGRGCFARWFNHETESQKNNASSIPHLGGLHTITVLLYTIVISKANRLRLCYHVAKNSARFLQTLHTRWMNTQGSKEDKNEDSVLVVSSAFQLWVFMVRPRIKQWAALNVANLFSSNQLPPIAPIRLGADRLTAPTISRYMCRVRLRSIRVMVWTTVWIHWQWWRDMHTYTN